MTVRFLALGDSYTIGEGVPAKERWPVQLTALLRLAGLDVADAEIVATTGWTTDELAKGIDAAAPVGRFDLVSLLIGVNNQYRERSLEEYRSEFAELLQRAIGFAGGEPQRLIVISIPDWGVTPFGASRDAEGIRREIDAFNVANREAAQSAGAAYADVTAFSREAASDLSLVADDGLHPSGAMYRRWAECVAPIAFRLLNAGH